MIRTLQRGGVLWLAAMGLAAAAQAKPLRIDGYAAVVNDRVITVSDVLGLVEPVRAQLETTYSGLELEEKLDDAYQGALESLVERALVLEDFKEQGGSLPEQAINDQVAALIRERFDNDRAAFLATLAQERVTLEEWREETKNRMIYTLMRRREVQDRVVVTPREVREAYENQAGQYRTPEQVKLRLIVLQKGETESDQAVKRQEAEQTRAKLVAGADFAETAKLVSEGNKASEGGDMGWLEPSSLRAELAAAAATLEPGRVSDVLDAGDAFYILKVEARKNAAVIPFNDVKDQIEGELKKAEEARLYAQWIGRLKNKYYVRVYEED